MLELLLRAQGVPCKQVCEFVLRDYGSFPKVSIASLKEDLEAMDMEGEDSLALARYLIEPRRDATLVVDMKRWAGLQEVKTKLSNLLGSYSTEDPEEIEKWLKKELGSVKLSLAEALDVVSSNGSITEEQFKEVL